jgi:hypothetical protein
MPHGPLQDGTTERWRMPRWAVPENLVLTLGYDRIPSYTSELDGTAHHEPRPSISMGLTRDTRHHF